MTIPLTSFGKPSLTRFRVLLFLVLWFAYGAAINSSNLLEFGLQQIGVEAIVERRHFYLEGSTSPNLQTKGDVFEYKGHRYAAKQPGQFMAGAVIYFLLHKLGLSYVNQYLLTAALVTFFTTSLVLAASAVALFELARELTAEKSGLFWPLASTLGYALATTAFAYSGIAHHDALATSYLLIAFYLIVQLSRGQTTKHASYLKTAGGGLLLGLTITTSMLPFFMAILCAIYFIFLRRWQLLPLFLVSMLAGLLPLFVYDALSFGHPLLLPNIAGNYSDTYFQLSPANFGNKVAIYAKALFFYAPIFVVGLFGFSYLPTAVKRQPHVLAMGAMLIVIAVYILNIGTDGDCQFGPRYLLPAMPFASLGIAGYSHLSTANERRLAGFIVVAVAVTSFGINLVGAMQGAMNCSKGSDALVNHLTGIFRGNWQTHPLALWLALPLAICVALLALSLFQQSETTPSQSATQER